MTPMLEHLTVLDKAAYSERFWSHVTRHADGCWLWMAAKGHKGYGAVGLPGGKTAKAHRVSYELQFGPIPEAACVLHRCDVPACVRPTHLFLGSKADNNADMRSKGRAVSGGRKTEVARCKYPRAEEHCLSRLTAASVRQARQWKRNGESYSTIAARLGVGLTTVYKAIKGITWATI
jgi:hypothetical protein